VNTVCGSPVGYCNPHIHAAFIPAYFSLEGEIYLYLFKSFTVAYNGAIARYIIHCANTKTVRHQGKALTDTSRKRKKHQNTKTHHF